MKVAFHDEITDVVVYKNMTVLPRVGDDIVILGDWRVISDIAWRVHGNWSLSVDIEPDTDVCVWLTKSILTKHPRLNPRRLQRLQRRWDKADAAEKLKEEANKKLKEEFTAYLHETYGHPDDCEDEKPKTFWARFVAWFTGDKL